MKPQEAKELVKQCGLNIDGIKNIECESVIISALEKQIPKRPIFLRYSTNITFACLCNARIKKGDKYCRVCGQALDWIDTE